MTDDEIEDLRTMCTGAFTQISELKDRVRDLEERVDTLEAENEMLRQAAAEPGEVVE